MMIPADTHEFAVFPLNKAPEGEDWHFVHAVATVYGGGTVVDPYRPGGSYQASVGTGFVGVYARKRKFTP